MLILHVTDLHLNERWFRWLAESAPSYDLLCISGDLLDRESPILHLEQVGLMAEWLRAIKRPLVVCSGSHDLEWDTEYECWRPARWLRGPVSSHVWGDGDQFELGGHRFHSISRTTYPKGAAADFWITHTPPAGLAVGRDHLGVDHGEPTLVKAAAAFKPTAVFCGDVHEPVSWYDRRNGVMYLNPGRTDGARFPNYIRFDTASHDARLVLDSPIGARSEAARWGVAFAEPDAGLIAARTPRRHSAARATTPLPSPRLLCRHASMKLLPFGRTDLEISNLCLSAANFGWNTDERTSHAILDTFCANGGNFVQAASSVNAMGTALSESHVGTWIERRDIERNELVLATKLVVRTEAALTRPVLAQFVRACCETSLRRLRVEYLDLLLCDMRSTVLPIEALLEALSYLVDEGLVHHVGASGMPASRLREASAAAAARSLPRFEVVQDDYSLVARRPFETELAAACRDTDAVFLARSPLAGGFLTDAAGRQNGWVSVGSRMWLGHPEYVASRPGLRDLIERIANARGTSIAQTALAWVLAHPQVSAVAIGVTSPDELAPLIAAAAETLSAEDVAWLAEPTTPRRSRRSELAGADA